MKDSRKRIPELDGIRGMAVLVVVIFHLSLLLPAYTIQGKIGTVLNFAWMSMSLFFVLSGFLIGGILLESKDATNYYKVFYARRFYRILPLFALLCVYSVAIFHVRLSTHDWLFEGHMPWYAYLTFGQNFWMMRHNGLGSWQLGVTWTLAIEEQFYLALPFVIRLVSRKALPYALGIGVILAPIIRLALWFGVDKPERERTIFFFAPSWIDALLLGVLAAYALQSAPCRNWLVSHKAIIGAATAALSGATLEMMHKHLFPETLAVVSYGYTLSALFSLSLLLLAVTQSGLVSRLFRFRALALAGTVSYGLYLFHQPLVGLVFGLAGRTNPSLNSRSAFGLLFLSAVLMCGLLWVSWRYFEKPLLKLGYRYQYAYEGGADRAAEVTGENARQIWRGPRSSDSSLATR